MKRSLWETEGSTLDEYPDDVPVRRKVMRKPLWLLPLVLLLCMASSSKAAPGGCGFGSYLSVIDSEQLTVSSTAIPFTAAKYARGGMIPMLAVVAVQTNAIRSLDSGLVPTASVGMPWAAASTFSVCGESNIRAFRMIRQTADATVDISYYKEGN